MTAGKNTFNKLAALFWLLAAADITGIVFQIDLVHFIAKCLLMPTLIAWLVSSKVSTANKNLIVAGLFTAWAGDILLLFDKQGPLFFIGGLICFLITHILYIIYFLKIKSAKISLLKLQPWWILIVPAYGATLVWILLPHLHEMKLPVIVYAIVICSMLLCSLHSFTKISKPSRWYFVLGALLFVISDSLLAVNKFYQPFTAAATLIMLTYCTAQYLVTAGCIKTNS